MQPKLLPGLNYFLILPLQPTLFPELQKITLNSHPHLNFFLTNILSSASFASSAASASLFMSSVSSASPFASSMSSTMWFVLSSASSASNVSLSSGSSSFAVFVSFGSVVLSNPLSLKAVKLQGIFYKPENAEWSLTDGS